LGVIIQSWGKVETPQGQSKHKQIFPCKHKTQASDVRSPAREIFTFAIPEKNPC